MRQKLYLSVCLLFLSLSLAAQTSDSVRRTLAQWRTDKFIDKVSQEASAINGRLTSQSATYLKNISNEEFTLKAKLTHVDSASAESLFGNVEKRYAALQASILNFNSTSLPPAARRYVPELDSVKNTLLFLQANKNSLFSNLSDRKLTAALANVNTLENKLQASANLSSWLDQRKQFLSQQLKKYGMANQLGAFQMKTAYYKQQVADIKNSLDDPSKLQQKGMAILSQLPAYKSFLAKNSYLARLFSSPDAYNLSDSGMKGLQTRASVEKQIQNKISAGGEKGEQQVGQNIQQAQNQITQWKSKVTQNNTNLDISGLGITPNSQKTKSLWKRLEYGANLQFESGSNYLPTLCDIGLSLGYRLNDRLTLGTGMAFTLGLGNSLQHITFSGQGLSLRSYIDLKWKKAFFISGGYEENYLPTIQTLSQLEGRSGWQKSGLIGISKKYNISKKAAAKAQLLVDFLSFYEIPRPQPVLFRIGWTFN